MITTYEGNVAALRKAFGSFPSGVVALSALAEDGTPAVMLASSFVVGVSQDPPLVVFAAQHSSSTWPTLAQAARLGVSVLSEDHADYCRQLSAKDRAARLDGVEISVLPSGAVHLVNCPVQFECRVHDVHPAGDHDLIVLEVLGVDVNPDCEPLVWHKSSFTRLAS